MKVRIEFELDTPTSKVAEELILNQVEFLEDALIEMVGPKYSGNLSILTDKDYD